MATLLKGDDEILIYGFDWTDFLAGDTIATSTWVVPTGVTQVSSNFTSSTAVVKIGGGTVDEDYDVTNIITTTTSDETAERTLTLVIVSDKYK